MSSAPNPLWLRTDEIEEFIGALEHCSQLAGKLTSTQANWKWLIIALHNALQGAFVCALRGSDSAGITMLTRKSGAAIWRWLDIDLRANTRAPKPQERLANLPDLYARVCLPEYLNEPHRLAQNDEQADSVARLNRLRNTFIHFVPKGLSLNLEGMPQIVRHCCEIITHLSVQHPTFAHHLSFGRRVRIEGALLRLQEGVVAWAKEHGLQND